MTKLTHHHVKFAWVTSQSPVLCTLEATTARIFSTIPFHCRIVFPCINIPWFTYLFSCWCNLAYFKFEAIINKAAMLWTFFHKSFYRYMLSLLLDEYLRVQLLDHWVCVFQFPKKLPGLFPKQNITDSHAPHTCQYFESVFFITTFW